MSEGADTFEALGRAGRRAAFHLIQALIEGLKAVEAVIEEVGRLSDDDRGEADPTGRTRIEIE